MARLALALLVTLALELGVQAAPLLEPIVLNAPESSEATPSAAPAAPLDAATPAAEPATEEDSLWPTVTLDTSFFNKYVWRGLVLTDGPVFQPSVTLEWQGLSLNVWGNLDLDNVNNLRGEFNEVDYTIGYEHEIIGPLSGSVGFIVYEFPNTAFRTTTEFMAGLSLDVPLQPSLTAYFDLRETDGIYLLAEIGHSIELPKFAKNITASVDLGAGLGWGSVKNNSFYFGVASEGATDYYFSLGLPIAIGEHLTITPNIKYTSILDGDLRRAVANDDNLVYGISLAVSF